MENKNILNNSNITAKGDVHIGDKIYNFNDDKVSLTPKDKKDFKALVQQLVANNQISKALTVLSSLAKNEAAIPTPAVISLTQRWKELKSSELMGIIRRQDANVERNQLVAQILNLIGGL